MSEFCFYRRKLLKSVGSAARGHVNVFSISGVTDDNIKSTLFLPQKFQILPWNYTCDIFFNDLSGESTPGTDYLFVGFYCSLLTRQVFVKYPVLATIQILER